MKRFLEMVTRVLSSRRFFWAVIIFFVLESVWIALSAVYPMAFDEEFHFGIIKLYSHVWLPFLGSQPDVTTGVYGGVAHDPSYLYHYLMSFPYRVFAFLVPGQTAQIIFLRLIDIALFAWGLVLSQRLLKRAGSSSLFVNVAIALLVLIPIVPLLAGQVNYDNLLMPVVAGVGLLTIRVCQALRKKQVLIKDLALLASLCLAGALVKYAFIPIFAAVVITVFWTAWRAFGVRKLWPALRKGSQKLGRKTALGLIGMFVVAAGLFGQRYLVNMVSYHTPIPDCAAVLSQKACQQYGPWARDFNYIQHKSKAAGTFGPLYYSDQWVKAMRHRLFFMISGPGNTYRNYRALPIPSLAFSVLVCAGSLGLVIFGWRALRGQPALLFLLLCAMLYIVVLWANNFAEYRRTGVVAAVNGRYLLPILLLLAAPMARSLAYGFRKLPQAGVIVACLALLLFLQGGGVLSFIYRNDNAWLWPNRTVQNINHTAQDLLSPLIYKGNT